MARMAMLLIRLLDSSVVPSSAPMPVSKALLVFDDCVETNTVAARVLRPQDEHSLPQYGPDNPPSVGGVPLG